MLLQLVPGVAAGLLLALTAAGQSPASKPASTGAVEAPPFRVISGPHAPGARLDGVSFGRDGTLYVAGAGLDSPDRKPGLRLGKPADGWAYPPAQVAAIDPVRGNVLHLLAFPPDCVRLTSVLATGDAVYVAGYAAPTLDEVIAALRPAIRHACFEHRSLVVKVPAEHYSEPRFSAHVDQRGAPFILKLSANLQTVLGATWLEGWQSTVHVPYPLGEDWVQPVDLALLPDGDLAVVHDGGWAAKPARPGLPAGFVEFYTAADYISRLSPDLQSRRWMVELRWPRLHDPQAASDYMAEATKRKINHPLEPPALPWTRNTLGQPRTLRMRADRQTGRLYLAGWSASRTSEEPWWNPYLLGLSARTGEIEFQAYCVDPFSGAGGRLNNLVSDSAVFSVAPGPRGELWVASGGDGGNSVLQRDPRGWQQPEPPGRSHGQTFGFSGRMLFWGQVSRLDPRSAELITVNRMSSFAKGRIRPGWPVDLAVLEDGGAIVVGRHAGLFDERSPEPLQFAAPEQRRLRSMTGSAHAYVRMLDPAGRIRYAASLPWVRPHRIERHGHFVAIAGEALQADAAGIRNAPPFNPPNTAAWLMVIDLRALPAAGSTDRPPATRPAATQPRG